MGDDGPGEATTGGGPDGKDTGTTDTGRNDAGRNDKTPPPTSEGRGPAADDDQDRERDRRLSNSTGDAFDALAREAYEHGRAVLDPTTLVAGRDAHVTIRTNLVVGGRHLPTRAPGRIREEDLVSLRARYVAPANYDDLRALLLDRHLLVLSGQPASGRTTSALHLLDDLTGGQVSRLDPTTAVADLAGDHVAPGHGYLATVADGDKRLSAVSADRFAEVLGRNSAYCVLVVGDHADTADQLLGYSAPCPPPDPLELVAGHIDADLPPDSPAELPARLMALARSARLRKALGPAPRTDEAAGLARLLLAHGGADEPAVDEIESELTAFLDTQVARWFAVLDAPAHGERAERARRLSALRIAIAVFDGLPSHIAMSAAESLAARMTTPFGPPSTGRAATPAVTAFGRPRVLTAEDDRNLLGSTRLVEERRTVTFRGALVPADVLRFIDPRTPSAVLRHIWKHRPALRRPLMMWLDELACDSQPAVRVRAAQAAGLLCSTEFAHAFTELIEPAARAGSRRSTAHAVEDIDDADPEADSERWRHRREFAALALDHAARDPGVRRAVTRTLRRWRRRDDPALRWTSATALGYDVGHADLAVTLDELRVLGTPYETVDASAIGPGPLLRDWNALLFAAGLSLARLFGTGAHEGVLRRLDEWMHHDRISLRKLAVQAVVLMSGIPVSGLGRPDNIDVDDLLLSGADVPTGRDRWPVLLALQGRHPKVVKPAAELVRDALRSPWREVMADVIGDWFDSAASDVSLLGAVESFLPLLVVEQSDRARLRALVRRKQRMWADPLPADVAARLDAALVAAASVPREVKVVPA
ncbi:hypothetical protein [Pseudonocardia humida]|uniref:HEAT repeat protein n=1 Tax=Pseudonocardia humida TaxID=2800819 RepID=A0ABT1A8E5_9PSEU|nr:hypothetical protein [Pseudonocardia humida]MCO1659311.1 hypothetical protein [Pseudonocardia humida]